MRRAVALAVAVAAAAALWVAAAPGAASAAWCGGTAESATDRPDSVPALAWHVIYAVPSDVTSRFPSLVEPIVADLSGIDAWWRAQDSTRAIRWDLADFPGCAGGVAALDLTSLRLAHDSSWFRAASAGDRFARLRDDIAAAGFTDQDKKVLAIFDGPLDQPLRECGISRTGYPATGGPDSLAVIYLGSTCGDGLGAGLFPAVAAIHEMTHSMNALAQVTPGQPGPPHACQGDAGHPCDSRDDLLYPSSGNGVALTTKVLDVGRDDYYGHSGSWWDVQDSLFLDRLDSPDRAAPGPVGSLEGRAPVPGSFELRWTAAADDVGPVAYEVYRDGAPAGLTQGLTYGERLPDGETHAYAVRARDAVGRLGPLATLRYTGGLGQVDENGVLLRDAVAPSQVARLRARLTAKGLFLTWTPAVDAGGVVGYRVFRDGKRVATTRTEAFSLPARRAAGSWTVQAVDRAGNLGVASPAVVVPARG